MQYKTVFVVWYGYSRRAETLAGEVNGQLYFQYEKRVKSRWLTPLRYLTQASKTWQLLERERPQVVMVQSPPVFAPLSVALWCMLRGRSQSAGGRRVPYVIDCHPGTFYDRKWRWALPLLRLLTRGAAVTLLCNEAAQDVMTRWKARHIFLPDGVPTLNPPAGSIGSAGEERVAVITTFSYMEPIAEIFDAARLLPEVTFYLTGDPQRLAADLRAQKPANVTLTGFLRGGTYSALLKNVHGMMILTKEPNDLSCGAYEALAMAKPAVITDWPGSRRCFRRGFVYVENTPQAIAAGVRQVLEERAGLTDEIVAMRADYAASRQPGVEELAGLLR